MHLDPVMTNKAEPVAFHTLGVFCRKKCVFPDQYVRNTLLMFHKG